MAKKHTRMEQELARAITPWTPTRVSKAFNIQKTVSITTSGNVYTVNRLMKAGTDDLFRYDWLWLLHTPTKDPVEFLQEKYPTARIIKRRKPVWRSY